MNIVYKMFKISFFIFLDVSGILLGILLVSLGSAVIFGWSVPVWTGWILLIIGVGAFLLHLGHYFDLKYMRWLFGSKYFIQK